MTLRLMTVWVIVFLAKNLSLELVLLTVENAMVSCFLFIVVSRLADLFLSIFEVKKFKPTWPVIK